MNQSQNLSSMNRLLAVKKNKIFLRKFSKIQKRKMDPTQHRSGTPKLPTSVEEGVSKFRVGEDFALAHRLQEREYSNHHRFNEAERHLVRGELIMAKFEWNIYLKIVDY